MRSILFLISAIGMMVDAYTTGKISDFKEESCTEETITLGWTYTEGDLELKRNYLVRNDDPPLPNFCNHEYCLQEFDYMKPCRSYDFQITPYFVHPGDPSLEIVGDTQTTIGYTADLIPGAPENLQITEQTDEGTTFTWVPPTTFHDCVSTYRVCSKLEQLHEKCIQTAETSVQLDLEMCASYRVTVTAVTQMELSGPSEKVDFRTNTGVPGPVVNLTVVAVGNNFVNITFRRPEENPYCIDGYKYNFKPVSSDKIHRETPNREDCDPCFAVFSPLKSCTNYEFSVNAYNPAKVDGQITNDTAATDEGEPKAPSTLAATARGPDTVEVIWEGGQGDPCAVDARVCWVDQTHPFETCQDVENGGRGGNLHITDLLPCSRYSISVVFLSPGGMQSLPIFNETFTDDIDPNPIENFAIVNATATTVTYKYSYPELDLQCVYDHENIVHNMDEGNTVQHFRSAIPKDGKVDDGSSPPIKMETEDGLGACTHYRISIRTISRMGRTSHWVNATFETEEDQPGPPRSLQSKYVDDTSITFAFYQPEINPSCAKTYTVKWEGYGGESGEKEYVPADSFPFQMEEKLEGLSPCTEYTISVSSAGEKTGESELSDSLVTSTIGCYT